MTIKFGDIEYFELLRLQDELKFLRYDRLGLSNLDKLRYEISVKIAAIHEIENERRQNVDKS